MCSIYFYIQINWFFLSNMASDHWFRHVSLGCTTPEKVFMWGLGVRGGGGWLDWFSFSYRQFGSDAGLCVSLRQLKRPLPSSRQSIKACQRDVCSHTSRYAILLLYITCSLTQKWMRILALCLSSTSITWKIPAALNQVNRHHVYTWLFLALYPGRLIYMKVQV